MRKTVTAFLLLLTLICVSACAALMNPEMARGDALFRKQKFPEALESYRKILSLPYSPQRDAAARYAIAVTLAYYDNPHRNYAQALEAFDDFLQRYPNHERAVEAQNWKSVLKTLHDEKRECEELKTRIEQLKRLDIRHEEKRKGK